MIRLPGLARLLLWLTLAVAASLLATRPARAHVPIILVITAPQTGERVGTDTELRVFAQAAIAGVEETSFTVDLDGSPLDPVSGRPAPTPVEVPIRVDETKRIPVRDLSDGEHTITVSLRPHEGEAPQQGSVQFVAGARPVGGVIAVAVVGIVAVLLTVGFLARRRRTGQRAAPDPPGG
jgi:hypothetical protein